MTQRDDMGKEVGGEFRTGNSCTPVVDSCQCRAKPFSFPLCDNVSVSSSFLKDSFTQYGIPG